MLKKSVEDNNQNVVALLGIKAVLTFLRQLHEMANTLNELCNKFKAIGMQTLLSRLNL